MSKLSDPEFLLTDQYKDASNLDARIQLHRRFSTNKYGWMHWVFDQIDLPPVSRILDLGCGPADLWAENLDRIPAGWEITLTDFSPGMVEQAQENLGDCERPFTFGLVDAQSIPCDVASFDAVGGFDAVIANHMLYHVPDRAKALAEMRRVLRPGGRLYTSTVGETHTREIFKMISRFDPEDKFQHEAPSFTLENGTAQLAPWFSEITLHRYKDDLEITEAEPLIAYVMSMVEAKSVFTDDKLAQLIAYAKEQIVAHGPIHVTKDSGMFEATVIETARRYLPEHF
ncbi:MAG: class I SAM-dependent methyltransferase [Anaerolineae bacterium]|nr:class I SAM-dependent methyltransferase [Anaerolineae bacterium]